MIRVERLYRATTAIVYRPGARHLLVRVDLVARDCRARSLRCSRPYNGRVAVTNRSDNGRSECTGYEGEPRGGRRGFRLPTSQISTAAPPHEWISLSARVPCDCARNTTPDPHTSIGKNERVSTRRVPPGGGAALRCEEAAPQRPRAARGVSVRVCALAVVDRVARDGRRGVAADPCTNANEMGAGWGGVGNRTYASDRVACDIAALHFDSPAPAAARNLGQAAKATSTLPTLGTRECRNHYAHSCSSPDPGRSPRDLAAPSRHGYTYGRVLWAHPTLYAIGAPSNPASFGFLDLEACLLAARWARAHNPR